MKFFWNNRAALAALAIAAVFLTIGVWRGEAEIVLRKSINICMECIGLG